MEPFNTSTGTIDEKLSPPGTKVSLFINVHCPWKIRNELINRHHWITSLLCGILSYFPFLLQMRNHWAHVSWATRGPYAKDSSQAFISIWVTVLSPQWPAPGTCHRGFWGYLSIKLRWPPPPLRISPFLGLTMQVLANSLHPIPPNSHSQFPHKDDISIRAHWSAPPPCLSMHVAC